MARPKKKKIELTVDGFTSIAQEAYNELVEQRNICIRTINENKNNVSVEDIHDLTNLNKVNTDLLKIIDSAIDKKLTLVKLMSQLVHKDNSSSNDSGSNSQLTPEDMELLKEIFKQDDNNNSDETYKM
jgi:hypothetical protein